MAGGVLTTGEEYSQVEWPHQFADNEIGILHLYGVHPEYRRTGISSELLQAIIKQAEREGKKAIHLDVLAGNVPSKKLYVKNGFEVVQSLVLHYDDIGDQAAQVLEYCIWAGELIFNYALQNDYKTTIVFNCCVSETWQDLARPKLFFTSRQGMELDS